MLELGRLAAAYGRQFRDPERVSERRAVYRLRAADGDYALKRIEYPQAEVEFIAAAVDHLALCYPAVSRLLPTVSGERTVSLRDGQYCLMPWLAGRRADYRRTADVQAVARAAALLHLAGVGFRSDLYPDRVKFGRLIEITANKAYDIERWEQQARRGRAHFDLIYGEQAGRFAAICRRVCRDLAAVYPEVNHRFARVGSLCHHDLAHHNVLIGRQGQVGFIDFDYVLADLPLHDLASLLWRLGKANDWQAAVAATALDAYSTVLPLDRSERRALPGYLRLPQEFWQLGLVYYRELPELADRELRLERLRKAQLRLDYYLTSFERQQAYFDAIEGYLL